MCDAMGQETCQPQPSAKPVRRALLAAVVLVALVLRAWGLGNGLPALNHPDEPNKVAFAQRMIRTGDLNPHYFKKGSLLIYATAAAQLAYYGWGRAAGWFEDFDDVAEPEFLVYGTGWTASPGAFLTARWLTVIVGVASVVLVYLCASLAVADYRAGLAAALFMALAPVSVENSRYITVDMYAVFFCLVAVAMSLRFLRHGRMRDLLLAGLAAGFAAGSKYPAALVLVVPLAAHLTARGLNAAALKASLALSMAAAAGFLITTPYALLASQEFVRDFVFEQQHYTSGHAGMEGASARYYADLLWNTEGAALCVLAAAGLALLVIERRGVAAVLAVFPFVYFASVLGLPVRNARSLLPVLPFLYLLAGVAVAALWRRLERLERGRVLALSAAVLVFACALSFPARRSAMVARFAGSVVAVEAARRWVEDNVAQGSRVVLEAYAPYVDPERFHVRALPFLIGMQHAALTRRFDYMIASRRSYRRFFNDPTRYRSQVKAYERFFAEAREVARFADAGNEIRIFEPARDTPRHRRR